VGFSPGGCKVQEGSGPETTKRREGDRKKQRRYQKVACEPRKEGGVWTHLEGGLTVSLRRGSLVLVIERGDRSSKCKKMSLGGNRPYNKGNGESPE